MKTPEVTPEAVALYDHMLAVAAASTELTPRERADVGLAMLKEDRTREPGTLDDECRRITAAFARAIAKKTASS